MPLAISQPRGFEAAQNSKIQLEAVYTNLQDAIDQANPGDTLILTGTFQGPFTIQKSLNLENANSTLPILDGHGYRVLYIQGSQSHRIDVNLMGLVIVNGCASANSISDSGCASVDLLGGNGAGILAAYANLNLSQSTVKNCYASGTGGGIAILSCNAVINASQILYNQAATGGGIFCLGSTCTIGEQTNIIGNQVTSDGGGIVSNQSTLNIDNSSISYNTTSASNSNGGGLYNTTASTISITNFTQIIYNQANEDGGEGGGIYNDASSNPAYIPDLDGNTEVSFNSPDNIYPEPS